VRRVGNRVHFFDLLECRTYPMSGAQPVSAANEGFGYSKNYTTKKIGKMGQFTTDAVDYPLNLTDC
jgi:hypothetical protein